MAMKTYSRARTAKAAILKVLDAHAIVADEYNLVIEEVSLDRFAAKVQFRGPQAADLLNELEAAGFGAEVPTIAADAEPAAPTEAAEEVAVEATGAEVATKTRSSFVKDPETGVGPTKQVWRIAESMAGAKRKDVIAACVEQGIAFGTARTQYQQWYTANRNSKKR